MSHTNIQFCLKNYTDTFLVCTTEMNYFVAARYKSNNAKTEWHVVCAVHELAQCVT